MGVSEYNVIADTFLPKPRPYIMPNIEFHGGRLDFFTRGFMRGYSEDVLKKNNEFSSDYIVAVHWIWGSLYIDCSPIKSRIEISRRINKKKAPENYENIVKEATDELIALCANNTVCVREKEGK